MKAKILFLLLTALLGFILFENWGCQREQNLRIWKSDQERIKTLRIKSKSEWVYANEEDKTGVRSSITLYDTTGNIVEETFSPDDDKVSRKTMYKNNSSGKTSESIEYDTKGAIKYQTIYEYDDDKLIGKVIFDADSNIVGRFVYQYDENGYQIEGRSRLWSGIFPRDDKGRETDDAIEFYFNTNGVMIAMTTKYHKHDKRGNRLEGLMFNGDGRNMKIEDIDSKLVYDYDENGNLILEKRVMNPSGELWYLKKYIYEYYTPNLTEQN